MDRPVQTRAGLFPICLAALIAVEAVQFDQVSLSEFAYTFRVGEKPDTSDALASEAFELLRIARPQVSIDRDQML